MHFERRHPPLLIALLMTALLLTGCVSSPPPVTSSTPASRGATPPPSVSPSASGSAGTRSGFVQADGRSFVVDGRRFRFVGVNIYDAASTDSYSCRAGSRMTDEQLLQTMRTLYDKAGVRVIRFWAYQTYTQGGTDWSGVDRVIAAARATGMRVLPTLEDGPGNCTTSTDSRPKSAYRGDTWYTQGYKVPYGNAALSYRDYVARIVAHYKDEPTILGWSMMNEADTSARDALGGTVLVEFARDIAGVIRANDPNHMITVGTQSNGAPGASGADFTAVYSLPQVSFAEVHDWGYWGSDTEAMPGGRDGVPPSAQALECIPSNASIGCSFARAAQLDKPLLVGEAGIFGRTPEERQTRAALLRAKMDAAFAAGASGYLIWSVTTGETDGYDLLPGSDDPLLEQMRQMSEQIQ